MHRKSTAATGSAIELDGATVALGNGKGNAESETAASHTQSASLGSAVKALEDVLLLRRGETEAGVRDLQGCPSGVASEGKGNLTTGWGVF